MVEPTPVAYFELKCHTMSGRNIKYTTLQLLEDHVKYQIFFLKKIVILMIDGIWKAAIVKLKWETLMRFNLNVCLYFHLVKSRDLLLLFFSYINFMVFNNSITTEVQE